MTTTKPEKAGDQSTSQRWPRGVAWIVVVVALVIGAIVAAKYGLELRRWTYEHTDGTRHGHDIRGNLMWGMRAVDEGWLDLYGNVMSEARPGQYDLDYPPLRLFVMRQWASWVRTNYPNDSLLQRTPHHRNETGWRPDYEFTRPLLMFNATLEGLAAVAVFLLVWLWVRRAAIADVVDAGALLLDTKSAVKPWTGVIAGFIGAMMLWFSPAVHLSAYGWPSSDIWIVPFFLWGVLLASVNWWFAAGVVVGVGTMLKGQQSIAAGLFVLWPLFMWRYGACLRWLAGYALAIGVVVSPWLLRDMGTHEINSTAVTWVSCGLVACAIAAARKKFVKNMWVGIGMVAVVAALLAWPWMTAETYRWLAIVAVAIAVVTWWLPFRAHGYLTAGVVGAAILLCTLRFNADTTWWELGYHYGAEKFPALDQFGSNTLSGVLAQRYQWQSLDDAVFTIPSALLFKWPKPQIDVNLRMTLVGIYSICLVLSAIAMAMHTFRPSRRFLVAITAVWLAAYVFMPQMHARYLLWAASVGAVMVGVGIGFALLDVLLIALAWIAVMHLMQGMYMSSDAGLEDYLGDWTRTLRELVVGAIPDTAWMLFGITAILLYVALTPSMPLHWRLRWPKWARKTTSNEPSAAVALTA